MTTYLCFVLAVTGMLMLAGIYRVALLVGVCGIASGLGYRLYAGEEIGAVAADTLFFAVLIPIGLWAARAFRSAAGSDKLAAK